MAYSPLSILHSGKVLLFLSVVLTEWPKDYVEENDKANGKYQ